MQEIVLKNRLNLDVYYEDTDFSGFVYHANYLKFFERSREHLIGIDFLREMYESGYHYVVHRARITYHAPARHGDRLLIRTEVRMSEAPSMMFHQVAYRLNGKDEIKLCTGEIRVALLNQQNKPIRMPKDIAKYFEKRAQEES